LRRKRRSYKVKKLHCYNGRPFQLCNAFNGSLSREALHTSGLVFGRPMTLLSFFH
jgi:hypothetical protein